VTVGRKRDEVKPNGKNWVNLRVTVTFAPGKFAGCRTRRKSYWGGKAGPAGPPVKPLPGPRRPTWGYL